MARRSLRIGVIILLCCMMLPVTGFATEAETLFVEETWEKPACVLRCEAEEMPQEESSEQTGLYLLASSKTLEETLYDGCSVMTEIIDVSQYGLSADEFERKYYDFCMMYPELLLDTSWSWRIIGGMVQQIKPVYLFPQEEMPAQRQRLKNTISAFATKVSELYQDPLEQMLYLHDSFAAKCEYDTEVANKAGEVELTAEEARSFHAYGLFFNDIAVCQGYAQAFYAICQELGYQVSYCRNNSHIWNYIKLDGEWYQMDVTWDDPVPDKPNSAIHKYFLCSDEIMSDHAPSQWRTPLGSIPTCNSTKYQTGYLFNFPAQKSIVKKDGLYQFVYGGIPFVSEQLWVGTVLPAKPGGGILRYVYLEEPHRPVTIYASCKDEEGILRKGDVSLRSGESMKNDGKLTLYSYTLPTGDAMDKKIYIRDGVTQTPCGPTLQF